MSNESRKALLEEAMPLVHINGTSVTGLIEQREELYNALLRARFTLRAMAPNMRDYYIADANRFDAALSLYQERLGAIDVMIADLLVELELLADERDKSGGAV